MILSFRKVLAFGIIAVLLGCISVYGMNAIISSKVVMPQEKRFFRVSVGFTDFSTINLTVIEKYGGEVVYNFRDFIAVVVAKIPRENITKLAEEDVIKYISYDGGTVLYGVEEPKWNVTVETTHEQLKLTMYLEKKVFQLGEDVKVKFTLTNIGEQNVTVRVAASNFDFAIYNSNNSEIHRWSNYLVLALGFSEEVLKPGENISSVPCKWEQIYRVHQESEEGTYSPKYNFLPVSHGTYYIVGEEFLSYPTTNTKIQTPSVEITILET